MTKKEKKKREKRRRRRRRRGSYGGQHKNHKAVSSDRSRAIVKKTIAAKATTEKK